MKISILSVCVEMTTTTCSEKLIACVQVLKEIIFARVEILKEIIFAQGQTNNSRKTLIVDFRVAGVRLKGEKQKLSHGKLN